jgi:hypothetical protein
MKSLIIEAIIFSLTFFVVCCGYSPTTSEPDGYNRIDGLPPLSVNEPKDGPPAPLSCQTSDAFLPGSRLVLKPVTFWISRQPPAVCFDRGVENLRIWVFRDDQLVSEMELPCNCDSVDIGYVEPGEYSLALIGESFFWGEAYVAGMILIERKYIPEYQQCDQYYYYRGCHPVEATVESDSVTVVPVDLFCHDVLSGGIDVCGGP